jgi:hypothetical protein
MPDCDLRLLLWPEQAMLLVAVPGCARDPCELLLSRICAGSAEAEGAVAYECCRGLLLADLYLLDAPGLYSGALFEDVEWARGDE